MAEPRKAGGGNGVIQMGGKSINMIRSQRDRIRDALHYRYVGAENNLSGDARDAEVQRLLNRMRAVDNTADRYEENIRNLPDQLEFNRQQGELYRTGGRSPEDALETARRINEIRNRRNNIRYPRSMYMRNRR